MTRMRLFRVLTTTDPRAAQHTPYRPILAWTLVLATTDEVAAREEQERQTASGRVIAARTVSLDVRGSLREAGVRGRAAKGR